MSTSQTREEIESITRSLRPGDVVEATRGYRTATGEVYALSGEHSGLALFYGVIRFSDSTTPDNLTAIRVVSRAYVRPDEPSTIGVVVIGANGNRYTRFGRGRERARENAEARRVEERERAQERMARAILVERRLSKAGIQASVQPYDDGTVVEMTIDAAERLADEVERLKATLSRVEALAEEWHWKEAVDAAARAASFTRRALIPTTWDALPEKVKLGWCEDVLPLVTAAAPFIAVQAAEAEREWWVRAVEQIWLGLGPTGRCDSGQPLLDLLALDKRRGGE